MIASSKHFSCFQFFTYYQPDNLLYNFTKMFQFCYRLVLHSFFKKNQHFSIYLSFIAEITHSRELKYQFYKYMTEY